MINPPNQSRSSTAADDTSHELQSRDVDQIAGASFRPIPVDSTSGTGAREQDSHHIWAGRNGSALARVTSQYLKQSAAQGNPLAQVISTLFSRQLGRFKLVQVSPPASFGIPPHPLPFSPSNDRPIKEMQRHSGCAALASSRARESRRI
jgi:hypothetical protein